MVIPVFQVSHRQIQLKLSRVAIAIAVAVSQIYLWEKLTVIYRKYPFKSPITGRSGWVDGSNGTSFLVFPIPLTMSIHLMTYRGITFLSIGMINIMTKSNLEVKGFIPFYNSQVIVYH